MKADRIELLRSLWEGDHFSMGYQSAAIVFHLCTLCPAYTEPNAQWVLNHLRANYVRVKDIEDEEEIEIIEAGLKRWRSAGKPRATFEPTEMRKELTSGS